MNRKIKLVWDFHGDDAQKTAEHHVRHLDQFMEREKIELIKTAVETTMDFHHMATMTVNEKDVIVLRDALQPHRAFVVE